MPMSQFDALGDADKAWFIQTWRTKKAMAAWEHHIMEQDAERAAREAKAGK